MNSKWGLPSPDTAAIQFEHCMNIVQVKLYIVGRSCLYQACIENGFKDDDDDTSETIPVKCRALVLEPQVDCIFAPGYNNQ